MQRSGHWSVGTNRRWQIPTGNYLNGETLTILQIVSGYNRQEITIPVIFKTKQVAKVVKNGALRRKSSGINQPPRERKSIKKTTKGMKGQKILLQ